MTEFKHKICLVVSSKVTVNTFLLEPIKILSPHYEVSIILKADESQLHSEIADKVTVFEVDIERKIHIWKDLLALFKIIAILRKHQFSLVHSVTPKAGLLAMLAGLISGVKLRIHTFTGQVWVTKKGGSRWILKNIDKFMARLATDVLVDSASQLQFLMNENVVSKGCASVLADGSISGVDTMRFAPNEVVRHQIRTELNFADQDIVFLFLGRINRDKGILDLAKAFAQIDNKHAKLLIVGPDEAGIVGEIQSILQKKMNLVRFVEFATYPENYMACADVLCLPSYREGFGNVIIEAAAVGIPAIGTRIYGLTDAIEDKYSGMLFEPRNVAELSRCMTEMLQDIELRKQLGAQARKRVVDKFSSEVLAKAWLNYYQERL